MTEFDSPWKESLDNYFGWFMLLCFPEIHSQIDWTENPKMLDKELQQIAPVSETGVRVVDKLVEVRLVDGAVEWVLIHVDVQNQPDPNFTQRMYVYHYRVADKYNKRVASLAVLGDNQQVWRPNQFKTELFGCSVEFRFPIVKLLDFSEQIGDLEESPNPFALVILAHLAAQRTKFEPVLRYQAKVRIVRGLYERGLRAADVRELFRVIDWMMDLPKDLEIEFGLALDRIEEDKCMPYITSIERLATERGIEKGIENGLREGIQVALEVRLGDSGKQFMQLLPMDAPRATLEKILRASMTATNVADLKAILDETDSR